MTKAKTIKAGKAVLRAKKMKLSVDQRTAARGRVFRYWKQHPDQADLVWVTKSGKRRRVLDNPRSKK